MRALAAQQILDVWEAGRAAHPLDRALALLSAALPGRTRDELAALSLGRRDAVLLRLRAATFADALPCATACPACPERLEFDLSCRALLDATMVGDADTCVVEQDGYRVRARAPGSLDVAAIVGCATVDEARRGLLERCVLEASGPSGLVDVSELAPAIHEAIGHAMLALDPGAEIAIDLECPACRTRWSAVLDVPVVLWAEIADRARRLLLEVHLLARAYGWREPDVLALSAARRATYLDMVSA